MEQSLNSLWAPGSRRGDKTNGVKVKEVRICQRVTFRKSQPYPPCTKKIQLYSTLFSSTVPPPKKNAGVAVVSRGDAHDYKVLGCVHHFLAETLFFSALFLIQNPRKKIALFYKKRKTILYVYLPPLALSIWYYYSTHFCFFFFPSMFFWESSFTPLPLEETLFF